MPDIPQICRAAPGSGAALGRAVGESSPGGSRSGGSRRRAQRYEASFERFASVFPDEFYITERGRYFPDDSEDKGRLLSAGYHSVLGFFRDDKPLMELILDDKGQQELNRLWQEFELHRRFHGAHIYSIFLQSERRSVWQGS